MYQVTFTSLLVPATEQDGITILRRAARCLAEKMMATSPDAYPSFDYDSMAGQLTVRSERLKALAALPLSIGSPVGHFGQLERSNSPVPETSFCLRVVYRLRPFTGDLSTATKQRLTREVSGRLEAFLATQITDFEVCPDQHRQEIVVKFDNAHHVLLIPEQFNAVFVRSKPRSN